MTSEELTRLFFSLVCLLGLAHGFGYAFERFRMPRVIGEIGAGILLGPTIFDRVAPDLHHAIFGHAASTEQIFSFLYWLGLTSLMFISGFHVQRHIGRREAQLVIVTLIAATSLPFAAGWIVPDLFDVASYLGPNANNISTRLIFAVAFAVTSIPVISKIFYDLGIVDTRFARVVLAVATTKDMILWMALSVATEIAQQQGTVPEPGLIPVMVVKTTVFVGVSLWIGPRLLQWMNGLRFNLVLKGSASGYLFLICFLFAAVSSFLNINLVFGALIGGMVVGAVDDERVNKVKERVADVVRGLFVPIYFALVGFRIDFLEGFDAGFTFLFIAASSLVELGAVALGTWFILRSLLGCLNLGVAMNTRGAPCIVLASVAFEAGIIGTSFHIALVAAAVLTSLISGIWFREITDRRLPLLGRQPLGIDNKKG